MLAVINNHIQVAQLLVDHGAHVDAHDKYFRTALHRAVATGAEECVELLLQARADPTMRYMYTYYTLYMYMHVHVYTIIISVIPHTVAKIAIGYRTACIGYVCTSIWWSVRVISPLFTLFLFFPGAVLYNTLYF